MFYFKPPGARGQALHQDQNVAARPARHLPGGLDGRLMIVYEANGCIQIVPGTQDLPQFCMIDADLSIEFQLKVRCRFHAGKASRFRWSCAPGDVLFFNGQVIHGSFPIPGPKTVSVAR